MATVNFLSKAEGKKTTKQLPDAFIEGEPPPYLGRVMDGIEPLEELWNSGEIGHMAPPPTILETQNRDVEATIEEATGREPARF